LRASCARLLGCDREDVALTTGTTRGVSDVALSIPWRRAERVLIFEGEFPANVTPWQCAARLFDLELCRGQTRDFEQGTGLDRLEQTLRRGVRLVAVSAVQFQTGFRMPLEDIGELCQRHGAELFVDGIQALGAVPIDLSRCPIDYLSCGAHKWLMGVQGAGLLYVHPDRMQRLQPPVAGWLSHEGATDFLFRGPGHLRYDQPLLSSVRAFEGGAPNLLGLAALAPALDLLLGLGIDEVFAHIQRYHDRLEPGLAARGFHSRRSAEPRSRSGSLCVEPPTGIDVLRLHAALSERGVSCSTPDGLLRFAPHWPNSLDEVAGILDRIDDSLESLSRGATPGT
jgi:selenocysteine lyase/cysteine desulfurase